MKNKKKQREVIITVIFAVTIVSISLLVAVFADAPEEVKYISYIVKSGDTLWEIAGKYSKYIEIREMISIIQIENSIEGDTIFIGQILQIPILE